MKTLSAVLLILMELESGNNPSAVGDGGTAYGVLQTHSCVVRDVNRLYGTRYRHVDMFNPVLSYIVAESYLLHYCGPQASEEFYVRTWNGGPRGLHKKATLEYYRKYMEVKNGVRR